MSLERRGPDMSLPRGPDATRESDVWIKRRGRKTSCPPELCGAPLSAPWPYVLAPGARNGPRRGRDVERILSARNQRGT
eukprot:2794474-Pyramimonas_sp.AAC.1